MRLLSLRLSILVEWKLYKENTKKKMCVEWGV